MRHLEQHLTYRKFYSNLLLSLLVIIIIIGRYKAWEKNREERNRLPRKLHESRAAHAWLV